MIRKTRVAPSVLAADLGGLRSAMQEVASHVDMFHLDVMDGIYVPNLTFGPPVIEWVRPGVDTFFDCHLMVARPLDLLEPLARAGADHVTLHTDACPDPPAAIGMARQLGLQFGLALSPAVPASAVRAYLADLDMVVVMSVEPGFGGQRFMPETLSKVETIRGWIDREGLSTALQIDGGIATETAPLAALAGADVFVAGTAIFGQADPVTAVGLLRKAISGALLSGETG
ncbi:MAG: ribulose-phosphate 3-epimerase [Actinomycetia bacterium]|nr:ribulose-phosphate 3-epimerase [Actinomycetes bacterium]